MNPALPEMHYVYILKAEKRKWLYIGYTYNLEKRTREHINGKSRTTRKYLPIKLVYYEAYISKTDAIEREKHLKQYGSTLGKFKKRIINCIGRAG
jgi:putative endonuclease